MVLLFMPLLVVGVIMIVGGACEIAYRLKSGIPLTGNPYEKEEYRHLRRR